jgi:hypothetical protein
MKTHEFADALLVLARMLKSGRNVELKDWSGPATATNGDGHDTTDAGLSLAVLAGLSRYSKNQWRVLMKEWAIPVEVRPTDSVRDLVGRLLRYLEEHPDLLRKIKTESAKKSTKASPELLKALSILLGEKEGEDKE